MQTQQEGEHHRARSHDLSSTFLERDLVTAYGQKFPLGNAQKLMQSP
jgi:hypothetical protein